MGWIQQVKISLICSGEASWVCSIMEMAMYKLTIIWGLEHEFSLCNCSALTTPAMSDAGAMWEHRFLPQLMAILHSH